MARVGSGVAAVAASTSGDLTARFAGELIWPDHPLYERARSLVNTRIESRPALIARCRGTADVVAALRWARERSLDVAVRSTGHNMAGFASTEGGLVIDLSLMRGVRVDPNAPRALIQGGATAGDIQAEAALFGLGAATGTSANTGLGLLLGGGFGFLRTRAGWSADSILAADLVTADGRIVNVSSEEHPELLWAVRGAGANFGVVTSLELQLHPVPPRIEGGAMVWGERQLEEALHALRDVAAHASEDLTLCIFMTVADDPALPPAIRGGPIVDLWFCHTGTPEQAGAEVALLREACPPAVEHQGPATFHELHFSRGWRRARRSADAYAVSELTDEVIDLLCGIARRMARPGSTRTLEVFDQRGALAREPALPSVQPRSRPSAWSVRPQTLTDDPSHDDDNDAWVRQVITSLRGTSLGVEDVCFGNSVSQPAGEARLRAFYGRDYDRLARLKRAWDPDNVFHQNQNVPPAAPI